jgi:DNA polymerase-3 subunit delta'
VLFVLTADSLAGVLPTIRSRCVSFAVAPAAPDACAAYCAQRGVEPKEAAMLADIFDGHIGTVLAAAQDPARHERLEAARRLAEAAATHDAYEAGALLVPYEKDKAGAIALLRDFAALAAAGLRQSRYSPLQGPAAQKAVRAANEACTQLGANQNVRLVLTVLAVRLGRV